MYKRKLNPLKSNSFFLFGARGTGKSTLVREIFQHNEMLEIDLLDPVQFEQARLGLPELLAKIEVALQKGLWIFIDEVQKAPVLLDYAQSMIDKKNAKLILSGSSARKLKRGGANLLAGRAYTYNIYPLTSQELENDFDLDTHLSFGGLPKIWNLKNAEERKLFLRSYITTYIKEEIAEEQVVRKLDPFTKFLQVAAQTSGTPVNYSNIAGDVGVSDQTVKTYFQILEDTLLGFTLPSFHESVRKTQLQAPKFYLYDTGVLRALRRSLDIPLTESNYEYGNIFEHFLIQEMMRYSSYRMNDYEFFHLRIQDGKEIDVIIDRPGKKRALIEIKSSKNIKESHTANLNTLGSEIKNAESFLLSQDKEAKIFASVTCLYWKEGIEKILG